MSQMTSQQDENMLNEMTADGLRFFKQSLLNSAKTRFVEPQQFQVPQTNGGGKKRKLSLGGGLRTQVKQSQLSSLPQTPAAALSKATSFSSSTKAISGDAVAAFMKRTDSGLIVCTHNEQLQPLNTEGFAKKKVQVNTFTENVNERYMYERAADEALAVDQRVNDIGSLIAEHHAFIDDVGNASQVAQEPMKTFGRIVADGADVKLRDQTIYFESSRQIGGGKQVRLNVNGLQEFSLFPGQVVGVEGLNNYGKDTFTVTQILECPEVEMQSSAVKDLLEYGHSIKFQNGGSVTVVAASGPYMIPGSVACEPLQALLDTWTTAVPDVIILMGPFVEELPADALVTELDVFKQCVAAKVVEYMLQQTSVQVVIIPSLKDAVQTTVAYPQPAFDKKNMFENVPQFNEVSLRVHPLANPSLFNVNEVCFGATTVDAVLDMCQEEIQRCTTQQDRLGRMVQHMFRQRSFYPLDPPATDMYLRRTQQAHYSMSVKPDVLFLPTAQLNPYVKSVTGTLAINCGAAVVRKGTAGTFVRITVNPLPKDELLNALEQAGDEAHMYHGVDDRARVEIVRL